MKVSLSHFYSLEEKYVMSTSPLHAPPPRSLSLSLSPARLSLCYPLLSPPCLPPPVCLSVLCGWTCAAQ